MIDLEFFGYRKINELLHHHIFGIFLHHDKRDRFSHNFWRLKYCKLFSLTDFGPPNAKTRKYPLF